MPRCRRNYDLHQTIRISAYDRRAGVTPIVQDISFTVKPGKVTALIGESGSGKTTIALACLGYVRSGCQVKNGLVRLDNTDVLSLSSAERRELRGRDVAYIAQSAAAAFNSALKINRQVIEPALLARRYNKTDALTKAQKLYTELDLPDPEHIGDRYPHQVSGGQLQRLMAAMAMICDPRLLILDEPTTALDVTTQIEVLRSFKKLINQNRSSAIYVSHDLAVVAQIADEVLVLKDGIIVEHGSVQAIIDNPQHSYTQELIDAAHVMPETLQAPRLSPELVWQERASEQVQAPQGNQSAYKPLLKVSSVTAGYGRNHQYIALQDVSLEMHAGRTLGVIGESGSGKTTLGRVISGLMSAKSGSLELQGQTLDDNIDARHRDELRHIQFVFQMADVALNPKHKISKILGRPLEFYFALKKNAQTQRVEELLELVELPSHYAARYPRQLSGGERQRINLARALAAEPRLIICDEITSALDTVVAKSILALLKTLQNRLDIGYLFISHDLSTIARIADSIAVMRHGDVLAFGTTNEVMTPPFHPYTELLLQSVPEMRTDWLDHIK